MLDASLAWEIPEVELLAGEAVVLESSELSESPITMGSLLVPVLLVLGLVTGPELP